MKIAAWSGPRNLSTAMMYSFGSRSDTIISDEPFYASYLKATNLEHPMRAKILESQSNNPHEIIESCNGPIPLSKGLWYQKHMCTHILDNISLTWAEKYTNIFLIRHPSRVISSYERKRENPTIDDIGFKQQLKIFNSLGGVVIESSDILKSPEKTLKTLCRHINIKFESRMLSWSKGGHKDEGVWGEHWYNSVHLSSSFGPPEGPIPKLSKKLIELYEEAIPIYEKLSSHKIKI
ncbi:MAG: HAD family hydrolase [Rhodobacteraceae bacterium]|nr:HAD family hydrolase [Paracoccaceae bacterium]